MKSSTTLALILLIVACVIGRIDNSVSSGEMFIVLAICVGIESIINAINDGL